MCGNNKHLLPHTDSVAQESGSGLSGWFWLKVTPEITVQLSARAVVSSIGVSTSELTHVALGWPQKIHFQDYTYASFHRTASLMAVGFPKVSQERARFKIEQESEQEYPRQKPQSFYNLISKGVKHYFCHIVFFRNESLSPAHTQGEVIHSMNTRRWGSLGAISQAANQKHILCISDIF